VKVLSATAGHWDKKQFGSEVELLTRVRHAHLCTMYACSVNGPQQCLLLELMSTALDDRLVAHPSLTWQQRVTIALHLCRSLVYLHSLSPPMIHRDVKCQNVLLNGFEEEHDPESVAKIADFGTVRADDRHKMREHQQGTPITHAVTRAVVGTAPYMPPEYTNSGHVSEKTDAFAMGVVLVELLISTSAQPADDPVGITLEARALVDREGANGLAQVVQAKALAGGWAGGDREQRGRAVEACKVVSDLAASCIASASTRKKPAEVLAALESVCQGLRVGSAYKGEEGAGEGGTAGRAGLARYTTS
jgi:serine/threonine protein kinase